MVRIIDSVEQFRKELKVGDVFWHMTSRYTAPDAIIGPCTIIRLWGNQYWQNVVKFKRLSGGNELIEEENISTLTNVAHAVFLNAEDAYEYFKERKEAYAQDPRLIARVMHAQEAGDRMRKRFGRHGGADLFP